VALLAGPWAAPLLESERLVDEIIQFKAPWAVYRQGWLGLVGTLRALREIRKQHWDWAIDARGDVRNILMLALSRASRRIGYDFTGGAALLSDVVPDTGRLRHNVDHHVTLAHYLGLEVSQDERVPTLDAGRRRAAVNLMPRVGFHFGASLALRRMPIEEAVSLLLHASSKCQQHLILIDAADTKDFNSELLARIPSTSAQQIERWTGTLSELKDFLGTLDAFYAMDSGPAHIAAALGVKTTVFFGPNRSEASRPRGNRVTVVERNEVRCRPCDQHVCTNSHHQECLVGIVRRIDRPNAAPRVSESSRRA
jgi:ADP-heptose:LPS heptosyltransferase